MSPVFVTFVSSLSRTAAGNGDAFDLSQFVEGLQAGLPLCIVLQSDVTAVSGTSPTMTVIFEDSVDGGTNWNTVVSFTAQTAVGRGVQRLGLTAANWPFNYRKCRIRWTMGGTNPNFTFSVKGAAL